MVSLVSRDSAEESTDSLPPDSVLVPLLKAAMAGASGNGESPWRLVVITDRRDLEQIPMVRSCARALSERFTVILVCGNGTSGEERSSSEYSCDTVTADLLAETERLGLGALCLRFPPEQEQGFPPLPTIPDEMVPFALIAVPNALQSEEMAGDGRRLRARTSVSAARPGRLDAASIGTSSSRRCRETDRD